MDRLLQAARLDRIINWPRAGGLRSGIFNIKLNFVITRNDRVAWMREMLTACKKSTLEIIARGWAERRRWWRWWISTRHYVRIESWKSANRAAIIQTKPLTRFPPISCRNDPRPPKRSFPPFPACVRHKTTMGWHKERVRRKGLSAFSRITSDIL